MDESSNWILGFTAYSGICTSVALHFMRLGSDYRLPEIMITEGEEGKGPLAETVMVSLHIPKHSLIALMAFLDKLPTKDRLQRMGLISESICVLCKSKQETRDHLFLKCPTAITIWTAVFSLSSLRVTACSWEVLIASASSNWKGKSLLTMIMKIALNALTYTLWEERNQRVFQNRTRSA
ncbi:uncharacterized protein LOC120157270 [Hibiscus syriacus]|uniref:uncharacterized protein LOC120157270 n=1 Tax=Hibiscus syriacus TaxID=106335 RepID=UPI001924206E|nr:uncharacterized protein LOC120157270 [Hibiscus syriacus]